MGKDISTCRHIMWDTEYINSNILQFDYLRELHVGVFFTSTGRFYIYNETFFGNGVLKILFTCTYLLNPIHAILHLRRQQSLSIRFYHLQFG